MDRDSYVNPSKFPLKTKKECIECIKLVADGFHIPRPKLQIAQKVEKGTLAWFFYYSQTIELIAPHGMTYTTLLHEITHAIHMHKIGRVPCRAHTKNFWRLLFEVHWFYYRQTGKAIPMHAYPVEGMKSFRAIVHEYKLKEIDNPFTY